MEHAFRSTRLGAHASRVAFETPPVHLHVARTPTNAHFRERTRPAWPSRLSTFTSPRVRTPTNARVQERTRPAWPSRLHPCNSTLCGHQQTHTSGNARVPRGLRDSTRSLPQRADTNEPTLPGTHASRVAFATLLAHFPIVRTPMNARIRERTRPAWPSLLYSFTSPTCGHQ